MPADDRLFWVDLEMTGLNPAQDRILEAAVVISSFRLNELERYETTVYQTPEVLSNMGEWCKQHHGASGLTGRVSQGISEEALDNALCELADRYFQNTPVILAGNSIGQDRRFIEQWLPKFSLRLHYRMLDVSSLKLVYMNLFNVSFRKENNHRALDDILESMAELRYYIAAIDPSRMPAGLG